MIWQEKKSMKTQIFWQKQNRNRPAFGVSNINKERKHKLIVMYKFTKVDMILNLLQLDNTHKRSKVPHNLLTVSEMIVIRFNSCNSV